MKKFLVSLISILFLASCSGDDVKIKMLAHSTGTHLFEQGNLLGWFDNYNRNNGTSYNLELITFPKDMPYGWKNYPYDYWNIWVNHDGYKFEPSLKRLTKDTDLIIWKHCFPGSLIEADSGLPSVGEERKSLASYKMQYDALKDAMKKYPETEFLVWTLAVMREADMSEDHALRTKEFVDWVKHEWNEPGDNIHIFDFYGYETTSTDGGDQSLYLRPEYATEDAHPNESFNKATAPKLAHRIVEVMAGSE